MKSKPDIIYAPAVSGLVIALVLKGIFDFIRKDNPDKRFVFPPICVVWEKVMHSSKRTQRKEFYNRIGKRVIKMCNKKIFYKIGFIDDLIDTGETLRRVKRSHRSSKISYFFITKIFEYQDLHLYYYINDIKKKLEDYVLRYKKTYFQGTDLMAGIVPRFGYRREEVAKEDRQQIRHIQMAIFALLKYIGRKIAGDLKKTFLDEYNEIIKLYSIDR